MCNARWSLRRWSSRASKNIYHFDLDGISKDTAAAVVSTDVSSLSKDSSTKSYDSVQARLSTSLTLKFIAVTILLSTAAAFSVGCMARILLLSKFGVLPLMNHDYIMTHMHAVDEVPATKQYAQLPSPTVIPGKEVPFTTYTSKNFRVDGAATSHTLHIDRRGVQQATEVTSMVNEGLVDPVYLIDEEYDSEDDESTNDYSHNDDSDGLHLPAGQHLLVDIKDVDSEFLNSEERLAAAMVELIKDSKLTLLSYHCHSLVPIGVSCAGVLLESHVAFHTWPKEGVITMDLFTCGGNPLIPVLSSIQELFGIPRADEPDSPEPTLLWSHKLRGFREGFAPGYDSERNPLDQDLGRFVLGKLDLDLKEQVVSAKTDFQTVDVYDVMNSKTRNGGSYHKSLTNDGSYESLHPEQFRPDRVLFLDGVIQSTLVGDAPYHESIVHPAMITHPNPKRVAIIGGGEGATLREVLKHSTVEEAAMIEIDEGVVDLSRQHLPQWQDCSSIAHHEKAAEWCFDDERVNARFEDAMAYFIDHFADDEEQQEEPYDIIIMDALDPNDDIEFAVYLYTSDVYIQSLYNALTSEGILVVQVGEVPVHEDPADETGRFANRSIMMQKLGDIGFNSIHVYEESHSGFMAPWSTLVAFKDVQTRANWYRNAAEIELQLQKRILKTQTGSSSLRYFDGATMSAYQVTPKAFADVHCRQENAPMDCDTSMLLNASVNETEASAYKPALERHATDSVEKREYAMHNFQSWN